MMLTRLMRSARRATGIPPKAYSTANAVPPSRPSWVSVSLRSTFIDWLMMEMMVRSMALKVYAVISSETTKRLYAAED